MTTVAPSADALAALGGPPLVPRGDVLTSRWPRVEPADVDSILAQLSSGEFTEMTARELVHEFEARIAVLTGTAYALTTNSGTSALHCALAGVGVEPGDEVVVPAVTYLGCAAVVLHQHAIPTFADVDPHTYNVTADTVEAALSPRTRAVIVVHMHGLPAPMAELSRLARSHGIAIVEDFSHAPGAEYRGRPIGSLGDAGAASLMAGKNLPAAGEGGVLVSNDREIRNRAAGLKAFGEEIAPDGSYSVMHETLGWNYRSNPLSLALAARQLDRLPRYNATRRRNAGKLDRVLAEIDWLSPPQTDPAARHVYHMYRLRIEPERAGLGVSVDQAREALRLVFWAEGLPLVEFQNVPLPGHALLRRKIGLGSGCPWRCHDRGDIVYDAADYPGALDAIQSSLVVGFPSHGVLCNDEVVLAYARCFEKVSRNRDEYERFAASLPSQPPWASEPRLF